MTEEQRIERYERPTEKDAWIKSFSKWDHQTLPEVVKCRFFKVRK